MDNAIDALKIAFAVFVFVMALSISMSALSQAKTVSDEVFYMTDKTNFYEYTADKKIPDGRFVSAETIIPTLYRYYKENFDVVIAEDKDNDGVVSSDQEILWEFNLEKEIESYNTNYKNAPWLGNANIDTKTRVDVEVSGIPKVINGVDYESQVKGQGILDYIKSKTNTPTGKKKIKETFKEIKLENSGKEITINDKGEVAYVGIEEGQVANPMNETLEIVKGSTKIEITYLLVNE